MAATRVTTLSPTIAMVLIALTWAPAQAQTGTLFVEGDNVGIGTETPLEPLHIRATDGSAKLLVEETGGTSFEELVELHNEDGNVGFRLRNPDGLADFNKIGNEFRINLLSSPPELRLDENGNLTIRGSLTTENPPGTFPDFVLDPDYSPMPLADLREFIESEKHLPGVMSATEVGNQGGVNVSRLQLQLLEKVEELTLYVLEQNDRILAQEETIRTLETRLRNLEQLEP